MTPAAHAQNGGTYTCVVGGNQLCGVLSKNCQPDYHEECSKLLQNECLSSVTRPCIKNSPNDDPNCGSTSQACCEGNSCDTVFIDGQNNSHPLSLTCYPTSSDPYQPMSCLDQAQIDALESGGGSASHKISLEGVTCSDGESINTAIGCIPINSQEKLVQFVLQWAIGIAGGIAFILIAYAGFMIITSSGQPDRIKAGQELLTSAISGLILLVFSVFILRLIGVDILKIPGL